MPKHLLYILLACALLIGCKQQTVKGVIIDSTLYQSQSVADNNRLCGIINRALAKDQNAVIELSNFPCGGGAGCYDLGYVVTQVINRIGEKEFINLTRNFTKHQRNELLGFITAGLEYGDNNYDGKMDDAVIDTVYPDLKVALGK